MRGGGVTIKVYGFTENGQGVMDVGNDLKSEQEFVGGRIEVYPINDDFILICNEDGINDGLKPRAVVLEKGEGEAIDQRGIREVIHGDCFVCRFDGRDGFESVKDEDIETIRHYVKIVVSVTDSVIEIEK